MGEPGPQQMQPPVSEKTMFRRARRAVFHFLTGKQPFAIYIYILNILLGASAVVLGIHDLLLSTRAAERATGAVFLVGGGLLLASAIAVLKSDKDETRGLALPGFVFGLIPGATLALIQFGGYGYSRRVWLWLLAVVIPVAGAVMVGLAGVKFHVLLGASSVALIAASIALLPPLLGNAFLPVLDTTIVDAQVDMKLVERRGDMAVIDTKLTIKNIGKRRLVFVGSMYSVRGVDSKNRQSKSKLRKPWPMASELNNQNWSARFESPWDEIATEVGYDFLAPGDILEPGQHHVQTILTLVPCGKYDTADVYAIIVTAYDDKLKLGDKHPESNQVLTSKNPVESIWDIEQSSWAVWLTRGPQDVWVKYLMDFKMDLKGSRFTGLFVEFGAGGESQTQQILQQYNRRIFTTYGLGSTTAYRSISLAADS
jgi:hypothetical protein